MVRPAASDFWCARSRRLRPPVRAAVEAQAGCHRDTAPAPDHGLAAAVARAEYFATLVDADAPGMDDGAYLIGAGAQFWLVRFERSEDWLPSCSPSSCGASRTRPRAGRTRAAEVGGCLGRRAARRRARQGAR